MRSTTIMCTIGVGIIAATVGAARAASNVQFIPATPLVARASAATPQGLSSSAARPAPRHPLTDVAALIEGDVSKVWNTYDDTLGPRTNVQLTNVVTHAGIPLPATTFSQLGGPLPSGGYLEIPELPKFTVGARYIIFLGQHSTIYSPIWARLAFRVETLNSTDAILGPDGLPVHHFGADGVTFGRTNWLSGLPDDSKRAAGESFLKATASSDPELSNVVGSQEFLAAAKKAMADVGSPLGVGVILEPPSSERWNSSNTVAQ